MSETKSKMWSKHGKLGEQAQMFTLQIWVTGQQENTFDWRGRIQHIQSGEVQYCRDWKGFVGYVEEMILNQSTQVTG
jgi:hypothetical protein